MALELSFAVKLQREAHRESIMELAIIVSFLVTVVTLIVSAIGYWINKYNRY